MSVRRIFINSYLAYINESNETLSNFKADFPMSINNPKKLILTGAVLAYYPRYPNFTPRDNVLTMTATSGGTSYSIIITVPEDLVYDGVSTGTVNLVAELNDNTNITSTPSLPTDFNTDIGTFTYSIPLQKIVFTPVGGVSAYQFTNNDLNIYRRAGLARDQIGVNYATSAVIFSNSPIIARTQVIYIASDLTNDAMTDGNTAFGNGIIAQMPIDKTGYGSNIIFDPYSDMIRLDNPRSFQSVNFRILDDLFQPIEWDTNANLALSFQVDYESTDNTEKGIGQMKNPTLNPFSS